MKNYLHNLNLLPLTSVHLVKNKQTCRYTWYHYKRLMTDQSGIIQSAACVLNTLWLKLSAYQSLEKSVCGRGLGKPKHDVELGKSSQSNKIWKYEIHFE